MIAGVVGAFLPGVWIAASCALAPHPATPTPVLDEPYRGIPDAVRPASSTYLSIPEWFVVYSTEEYAAWLRRAGPSSFPYFRAIGDYWGYYHAVCEASCGAFPFDGGDHAMLVVIGGSFTLENAIKGIYENSIGRLSDGIGGHDTEEDAFAASVAEDYGRFMHTTPWYDFPFGEKLGALWTDVPLGGAHPVRKWERRFALSAEYAAKALYGTAIRVAAKSTSDDESDVTFVHVDRVPPKVKVTLAKRLDDGTAIVSLDRDAFAPAAQELIANGARLIDVAGNRSILITVIAPFGSPWSAGLPVIYSRPTRSDTAQVRALLLLDTSRLGPTLAQLRARGVTLEHIYDY